MESSKTYTVKQVAKILGFSTNTVYKYLDEGKIKATRLGIEGRFRIPEEELIRLVGKNNAFSQPLGTPIQPWQAGAREGEESSNGHLGESIIEHTGDRAEAAYKTSQEKIISIVENIYNPDLFDWFLGLSAVFLGVAFLLFPYSLQNATFEPYRQIIMIINGGFIALGIIIILLRLFISPKVLVIHITSRIILSVAFLAITLIYFKVGEYWSMTYFGTLGVFALFSALSYFRTSLGLIFFIYALLVSSAIVWVQNPTPYFILGDVRYFVSNNPGLFEIAFAASATVILAITILSYFRIKSLFVLLCVFLSMFLLLIAFEAMITQAWSKAVVLLLSGSFALLIPFERNFDFISDYSKRHVFYGFVWLIVVTLLGIGLVWFMQKNFEGYVLDQQLNKVAVGSKLVDSFAQDSIAYMNHISEDQILIALLTKYNSEEFSEEDETLLNEQARQMFLGSTTLRRLAVFNTSIEGISLYPPINGTTSLETNASSQGKEFLRAARDSKKTVVSTAITPNVAPSNIATIFVVAPVIDKNGSVVGILSGSLDFDKLYKKLISANENGQGHFVIADKEKTILLHPDKDLLGKNLNFNNGLALATEGKSGSSLGYSETGILTLESYTPIESLGWGIVSKQPYADAFRKTSLVSFLVFLTTILLGVGSLLAITYSIRKRE